MRQLGPVNSRYRALLLHRWAGLPAWLEARFIGKQYRLALVNAKGLVDARLHCLSRLFVVCWLSLQLLGCLDMVTVCRSQSQRTMARKARPRHPLQMALSCLPSVHGSAIQQSLMQAAAAASTIASQTSSTEPAHTPIMTRFLQQQPHLQQKMVLVHISSPAPTSAKAKSSQHKHLLARQQNSHSRRPAA